MKLPQNWGHSNGKIKKEKLEKSELNVKGKE